MAQQEAIDFIAFLKLRYAQLGQKKADGLIIENEPFVGMWKNRADMVDSNNWVRNLRKNEWN